MKHALVSILLTSAAFAADQATLDKGKAEEKRSCTPCHGLRIIQTQRLPRGAWERELDKMVRWGATIKDREPLMDYLVANFGDDKPIPAPLKSGDGANK